MPNRMKVYKVEHNNFKQLDEVANQILHDFNNGRIFTLQGQLGAGKTALINSFCRSLGINRDETSSPTFSLINEYNTDDVTIFHFDLYRLELEDEAYDIGIEEYLYSSAWCFIEWPEKIPSHLPENFVSLKIEVDKDSKERVIYVRNVI
jgi:tRNA threonylcarbamoyladenosine biosynthesis protein TsaE